MRLFIALNLPDEVIAALEQTQQRLKRTAAHPVKWVAPATMHLTLQFLGEVDDARVPALLAALEALPTRAALPLPTLALAGVGAFPNLRRPQTIWVGVGGELAALERLYASVIAATAPLGFPAEQRPFRAHLTLGRARRDAGAAQLAVLGQALAALPPPHPLAWQSGPPILFQSTLTGNGPVYRALS